MEMLDDRDNEDDDDKALNMMEHIQQIYNNNIYKI